MLRESGRRGPEGSVARSSTASRGGTVRKVTVVLLAVAVLGSVSGQASYICTDDRGKVSIQDRPCAEKKASTTNVPIKSNALSDQNSLETIERFYKAMS